MNITLTPRLRAIVQRKLDLGLYGSASEVVSEALRLLEEREKDKELRLTALRHEISATLEEVKKGRFKDYTSTDAMLRDIKTAGRKRLQKTRKTA